MESFTVILSRLWGLYVTNAVLTGCWTASINPHNTSLLYAWLVSLCDLVYITDALARMEKRVYRSVITANLALFNSGSPLTSYEIFVVLLEVLTLVPYHAIVVLELDDSWAYIAVCVLRLAVLLLSGRFYVMKAIWKTRKQRRLQPAQKGLQPRDNTNQEMDCSNQAINKREDKSGQQIVRE